MIAVGREILELLRLQQGHYGALKQAVEKQTAHIEATDIGRLTSGTSEVRGLMRKIRDAEADLRPLRQSWSSLGHDRPPAEQREIDALVASIRELIVEIQETKNRNADLLKGAMDRVRKQMAGLNSQAKAAQAYRPRPARAARFVDKAN